MSRESLLKKEFKERDIQRVRNIVNKDFTAKTKSQTGYQKKYTKRVEGDIWEESGKTWTIKNGIKQNVTKLDKAKKAARIPLACPNCGGPMKHHLAKKMYKIHGFCFDPCTVKMETDLMKAGLYEQYEKQMIQGNMREFTKMLQGWVEAEVNAKNTFVTEQGDVEDWNQSNKVKEKLVINVQHYLNAIKEHIS